MPSPPATRAFLAAVLSSSPEPLLVVDESGVIKYANRAVGKFCGTSESRLLGFPVARLLPDWFSLPALCRDFPTKAVLLNGKERPVTITLGLVPLLAQEFTFVAAVFRDSRQSQEDSERRLDRENKLEALVQERDRNIAKMHTQLSEAATILERHLPARQLHGLSVSWVFEPCQTLGGDMVILHRHEDKVILGMLDVSGHGVAASLLAIGMARSLSPERGRGGCVLGPNGAPRQPKDIVTRLNQDSHTLFESGLFVTLLFGILDLASREFCFSCAGHPLPVIVGQAGAKEVEGMIDPPLGLEQGLIYRQMKVSLTPGELLVLYTDGVTEARSPSGEFFGEERLMNLVSRSWHEDGLANKVSDSLSNFRQALPAPDDMSFLAIRLPGSLTPA